MAIFSKKAKPQNIEAELAVLRQRVETLDTKRLGAEADLAAATEARQRHLVEGDLNDAEKAQTLQGDVNSASASVVALEDAISLVRLQIADAEAKVDQKRRQAERDAAADTLSGDLDAIEKALPEYLGASRCLAEALLKVGHFHFESGQASGLAQNTLVQIESAAPFILEELRGMVTAIRDDRAPIPPKQPVAVAPVPAAPAQDVADHFEYRPYKSGPTYRLPVGRSPKVDAVLAQANFTEIDRSGEAREIIYASRRT